MSGYSSIVLGFVITHYESIPHFEVYSKCSNVSASLILAKLDKIKPLVYPPYQPTQKSCVVGSWNCRLQCRLFICMPIATFFPLTFSSFYQFKEILGLFSIVHVELFFLSILGIWYFALYNTKSWQLSQCGI